MKNKNASPQLLDNIAHDRSIPIETDIHKAFYLYYFRGFISEYMNQSVNKKTLLYLALHTEDRQAQTWLQNTFKLK